MKQLFWVLGFLTLVLIFIIYCFFIIRISKEGMENETPIPETMKVYVINLDKNKKRLNKITAQYEKTDLAKSSFPLGRFSAVDGKTIDPKDWLSADALKEYKIIKKTNVRTRHYQLTTGAIGCFLSHAILANRLLHDDSAVKYYFILEDDALFLSNDILYFIKEGIREVPNDWHIISLGYITAKGTTVPKTHYKKVSGMFGLQGYIISREGAKKFINEMRKRPIDAQVDSYFSRMAQKNNFNIYVRTDMVITSDNTNGTDIQTAFFEDSPEAFHYDDIIVI